MRLTGKIAIVTGGGQGIGRGISLRYAQEGAKVVVADINAATAQQVAEEVRQAGGDSLGLEVDVTQQAAVTKMVSDTVAAFGGVDILVNNAGNGQVIPFFDTTEDDFDKLFAVNCKSVMFCCQAVAKQMIAQKRPGKIVNLASQAGRRGEALVMAYCASKAAVISMNQSIALALAPQHINVNAIAPGVVDTPLWEALDKQFAKINHQPEGAPKQQAVASIPLGRIEQPQDVASAAVFLASDDANYITQQCLNVDGGNWPS